MFGLRRNKEDAANPLRQSNIDRSKKANKFKPCILCGAKSFSAVSKATLASVQYRYRINQTFDCNACGLRQRLTRPLDGDTWAANIAAL